MASVKCELQLMTVAVASSWCKKQMTHLSITMQQINNPITMQYLRRVLIAPWVVKEKSHVLVTWLKHERREDKCLNVLQISSLHWSAWRHRTDHTCRLSLIDCHLCSRLVPGSYTSGFWYTGHFKIVSGPMWLVVTLTSKSYTKNKTCVFLSWKGFIQ